MSGRARGWMAACGALLACAGCGFKGPLYLPEHNTTVVTHAAAGTTQTSPAKKKAQTSQPAVTSPQSPNTPPLD